MLDRRSLSVLEYLDSECLNCGYKVFSFEEMLSVLPNEYGLDKESLSECILSLAEHGYINVKYIDEKEVCLSPLPKGRLIFENRLDGEIEKTAAERRYFGYSFFGAIIGGAVFAALAFAVMRIARLF